MTPDPGAGLRHGTTRVVSYPSRHEPTRGLELTGLLHLPHQAPGAEGWPMVTYGHMTTGASPGSAPSLGWPGHPEWRRMSQGDDLCDRLLAAGVAVLRPDYPGLGSTGAGLVHPYLVAEPLGHSVVDMVAARRDLDPRLGDRWVSAGHSEGSVAALASSTLEAPVPLLGVAAFAPVPRMDRTIGWAARMRVTPPGFGVVPALVGLMLLGARDSSPRVAELLDQGHLGAAAARRWDHLSERCLTELAARDSWGAIAGRDLASPQLYAALLDTLQDHDISRLRPPVPVRVDSGLFDEVAPAPLTAAMVRTWRSTGIEVTHRRWPTHHSGTMRRAPAAAAAWILARLAAG